MTLSKIESVIFICKKGDPSLRSVSLKIPFLFVNLTFYPWFAV